jgi:hypothetical protein
MICTACKNSFDIDDHLRLGVGDGDCAEVTTACPHCRTNYYAFTNGEWTSGAQAAALFKSVREQEQAKLNKRKVCIVIRVRCSGGSHLASAIGFHGIKASCSCDPNTHAVRLCALKCKAYPSKRAVSSKRWESAGIKLIHISRDGVGMDTYHAEWEEAQ